MTGLFRFGAKHSRAGICVKDGALRSWLDPGEALALSSATASAWEPTPWRATQRAAWEALRQAEGSQ